MAVVLVLAVLALVRAGECLGDGASLAHLVDEARGIEDWLLQVRRTFHAHPELMYQELNTSSTIRRLLDEMNIPYRYPVAKTGLVATIGTGSPVVALRTDIDALPILEDTGVDFSSTNPGVMHACGHDAHMTMLLGAAKLLKGREGELQGSVKLLFQPAEEGGAGGDVMVKEGALEGAKAAFGMHVWPVLPSGTIASRPGTIMAGSVVFEVVVTGRGGHAAMPHLTADPVVAASAIATSLQTLVSRETSPFGSAVVSVTKLSAGDAYNVIPDTVTIGGTVRTTSDEQMKALQQRIEELVSHQAAALRCEAQVDWLQDQHPYYPPVVNDPEAYKFAADVATRLVGDAGRVVVTEPSMAGEDFSFIARAIPSSFIFLGIRNETAGSVHGLHTPRFTMDEGVMKLGVALHTALATEYLRQYHAQQQGAGEGGVGGVGVNDEL